MTFRCATRCSSQRHVVGELPGVFCGEVKVVELSQASRGIPQRPTNLQAAVHAHPQLVRGRVGRDRACRLWGGVLPERPLRPLTRMRRTGNLLRQAAQGVDTCDGKVWHPGRVSVIFGRHQGGGRGGGRRPHPGFALNVYNSCCPKRKINKKVSSQLNEQAPRKGPSD